MIITSAKEDMFLVALVCVFVRLSVCKITVLADFFVKYLAKVNDDRRNRLYDLGGDLDQCLDPVIFYHCQGLFHFILL